MCNTIEKLLAAIWLITCFVPNLNGQHTLREDIVSQIRDVHGNVGLGIKHIERNDTLSVNGKLHFPMQSVYKFHLALAVLDLVDKGDLSVDQKIPITKSDLLPNSWSPIAKKYPQGNVELTIKELLHYTVAQSDNSSCDILFRLAGGTKKVEQFIHGLKIKDVAIAYTEAEMHQSWDVQYRNWTTPQAMVKLLDLFQQQKILSSPTHHLLMNMMERTITGKNRIKGLLPNETIVAHKTGMSGRNAEGMSGAVNDVGIINLPNGEHIAIAFFVSNSKDEIEKIEALMAKISRLVYDYYTNK